ncbi:hypothetical protein ACOMHN_015047 [Nucella lapillus]
MTATKLVLLLLLPLLGKLRPTLLSLLWHHPLQFLLLHHPLQPLLLHHPLQFLLLWARLGWLDVATTQHQLVK